MPPRPAGEIPSATDDDPDTPSMRYSGIKSLHSSIRSASGDALRVEGVTPADFSRILAARSESRKCTLFFFEDIRLVIVGVPAGRLERAKAAITFEITNAIRGTGLRHEIRAEGSATFRQAAGHSAGGSGEADGTFTPRPPTPETSAWPSIVVEVGFTPSVEDLRMKTKWWLEASDFAVKVVILVKGRESAGTITLEKWKMTAEDRPGATTTRGSQGQHRHQIECVQRVTVLRSVDGIAEAYMRGPGAYVVDGGPLRLQFSELVLRGERPGSCDVIISDEALKDTAIAAW